jgi:hypothetical protein
VSREGGHPLIICQESVKPSFDMLILFLPICPGKDLTLGLEEHNYLKYCETDQ